MNIKKFKLFESPDNIQLYSSNGSHQYIKYDVDDAKPFAWTPKRHDFNTPDGEHGTLMIGKDGRLVKDKLWVGELRDSHSEDCPYIKRGGGLVYSLLVNKGRLWYKINNEDIQDENINIISFWNIEDITDEEMASCIEDLERETGEDLSFWSIDLGVLGKRDKNGKKVTKIKSVANYKKRSYTEKELRISELYRLLHVTSNSQERAMIKKELKELTGKEDGVFGGGSKKTAWDSENPIPWRQAKMKSEGMEILKFCDFEIINKKNKD